MAGRCPPPTDPVAGAGGLQRLGQMRAGPASRLRCKSQVCYSRALNGVRRHLYGGRCSHDPADRPSGADRGRGRRGGASAGEINAVLAFVEQLEEVNVEGVEPMTSVTPMEMKMREDVVTDGGIADAIVANAPAARIISSSCPRLWSRIGGSETADVLDVPGREGLSSVHGLPRRQGEGGQMADADKAMDEILKTLEKEAQAAWNVIPGTTTRRFPRTRRFSARRPTIKMTDLTSLTLAEAREGLARKSFLARTDRRASEGGRAGAGAQRVRV